MKERPILFSGPMVRAIFAGQKTQTRRVVKALSIDHPDSSYAAQLDFERIHGGVLESILLGGCPYGQPGDRLWVRETWTENAMGELLYKADWSGFEATGMGWKSSIHMPRAASRITLEITGVRVERIQDISEADAVAEGVPGSRYAFWGGFLRHDDGTRNYVHMFADPGNPGNPPAELEHAELERMEILARDRFHHLWNTINAKRGYAWESNPFVWVSEFKRLEPPNAHP
ncbi:MAG TPA: hypothetical protein VFT99_12165 [Roseiflexaceae bacterium]|nr:hypothetical protein [Roseiflexaceae bacterium]